MKFYKKLLFLIVVVVVTGCKKNTSNKATTISGQLLESSSNRIPVNNYKLTLTQNRILSPLGSVSGVDQTVTTDNDGKFSFTYSLTTGSGIASGSTNPNNLYISSYDTLKYKELYPEFNPITVSTDTSLNTIFLYKKIDRLVRKIKFDNQLNTGDVLDVITLGTPVSHYKKVNGPISAGTVLTVDTISNYRIARLNLQTKKYTILSALKKPMYQTDLNTFLDIGDENYREILMTY